jgi:hypothetical protein
MHARPCAHHPASPAIARCTRCDRDVCIRCHKHDMRGFAVCTTCAQEAMPPAPPWERPAEGTSNLEAFARTWWSAVRSPTAFFESLPERAPWLPAIVFGLACMGIGQLFHTIWGLAFNERLHELLMENALTASVPPSMVRALSFARIPFLVPAIMAVHILMLHTGASLAGATRPSWNTIARIFGYSTAGYLFLIIPPIGDLSIGHLLMLMWMFNLETAGLRRFFELDPWRAMIAAIIPMFIAATFGCL